jgi:hypothetical protein
MDLPSPYLKYNLGKFIAPAGPQSGGFWRGLWSTPSKRRKFL